MIQRLCSLLRMNPPVILNRGLLFVSGATVPEDNTDGYQTGCIFQHTDGDDDTSLYVNEGSVTACDFNPVSIGSAGEMSQIEFDDDLTGPLISIDTTDPTGDSFTTPFLITGTYSSTCALALQLSATNQRPVSFLFDDGGEILGSGNYRAVLSRVMLCSTQTGQVAIRAIRGQVKAADGLTLNIATNEMNAINGVEGYIELAGTTARTVGANTRLASLHALMEVRQDITLTAGGKVVGVLSELCQTTAKTVSGIGTAAFAADRLDSDHVDAQALWTVGYVTGDGSCTTGVMLGSCVTAINVSGQASTRVLQYATVTDCGEAAGGHLIQYGTSVAPIVYTPSAAGSDHSGLQMYVTSDGPAGGGLGLAIVRVKVTLTGTTKITANAGQFWTRINCTDYTGDYTGGHPTGLSGIIECAGTARTAASPYAVMAGVCGEVRPITTSGTVNVGGVICGLHAKIFGVSSDVDTGDVVGLFVQAISSSAADIGILIQPHTGGAAWTTGLEFDSSYGTIANGIVFTGMIGTRILDYTTVTAIDEPAAGHLIRYGVDGAPIQWTPTATCSGLQMYITSTGPEAGGFGLAGVRVKVTLTGTTRITANAGQFWTKIDCVDYTGDYTGGHPTGLSGIIELAGTDRQAASPYAVMAGVVGEVRPITCTTPNVGGVICGVHAKIFGTGAQVTTGSVVGLFVQSLGAATSDIGILIQPHTGGAAWTVGIDIDSVYGAIATGIDIGNTTTGIAITGTSTTAINVSGAAEYGMAVTWATTSTKGSGADPLYGTRDADSGVQGCISVGTPVTAGTVNGIGSHVAYQSHLSLEAVLEQYSLFGGALHICTLGVAQAVVDAVACGVTGYIRNIDGGKMETVQQAVRGCIYTHTSQEGVRQTALHGAIIDKGAATGGAGGDLSGLSLTLEAASDNGGERNAIFVQTDNSAQDWTSAICMNEDNLTFFARFNSNEGATSACKPAQVVQSSITDSTTADALVKIEIDGTAYYMVAFTKAHVTNESA